MNLSAFVFGGVTLLIQQYVNFFKNTDLELTLKELEADFGFPRISNYDYIIVGGGSAGCLLASRLSEKYSVLLLEKGGNPVPHTASWMFYSDYEIDPNINDLYEIFPQENFARETESVILNSVGRMMGGSGSHNADVYNRGSPFDYDQWANLTGDNSWSYTNMLKHFRKIENFVGPLVNEKERDYYGTNGPLEVTTLLSPHLKAWFEAGEELGFKIADPNAYQIPSFSTVQASKKNGIRDSSYTSYLKPLEGIRKGLKVLRYSEVDRILIENGKAYGVAYKRHGFPQIAHARREVILSAGIFASPIILIKSGVGPKNLLLDSGIPLMADVPGVGENLQDHVSIILLFTASPGSELSDIQFQTELQKFHFKRKQGSLAGAYFAQAFVQSSVGKKRNEGNSGWPDIHLFSFMGQVDSSFFGLTVEVSRPKSAGKMFFNVTAYKNGETDTVKLGRPDYKYLTVNEDLETLVEGAKLAIKIYEDTKAFKHFNITFSQSVPKACEGLVYKSDGFWRCYILQRTANEKHNVGTCKMGRNEDQMAVVDSKLRVKGVEGLRVVDASVMPKITDANTNAPTLAIAEKIVSEILQEENYN